MLRIESSDSAKLGENYTLNCTADEFNYNPIITLTWRNNSDHVTNSSTNSSVVLLHLKLNYTSVGNYTCSVAYSNGDSRQLTEQVVAEGKF